MPLFCCPGADGFGKVRGMPVVISSTTDTPEQVDAAANPPPVVPAPTEEVLDAAPGGEDVAPVPEADEPPAPVEPAEEDEEGDDEAEGEAAPRQGRAQRRITNLIKRTTK